ncbi:FkbM family methyltransferase [Deminuibacter soli]|uniref:FkbM family methyltransferase n=1 Tax=Deminuibacter soli TaxID=2291815 RepID=A0A3E1NFB9_9BACT|nr:FkbM family methyltransferase [Deminuibacter soli]RFM26494.1 FkbM family methyltransferase [Deminuibacter soli]
MKELIRKFLQRFGYDIVKYNRPFVPGEISRESVEQELKWLKAYQFAAVVDIGANDGQFSEKMRLLLPDAFIYAFEPIPQSFQQLQQHFRNDNKFKAFNVALGETAGELQLFQNEYTPSSSLLPMADAHISNFDTAVKTQQISVKIEQLDAVLDTAALQQPLLVKIDVQGYEDKVINGGGHVLKQATMIICELSFVELYKGQLLFADIVEKLKQLGFRYAGSLEQLRSPETNQVLQADGIFVRQ